MPKPRLFNTGDASRLLKLTRATIDAWIKEFVEPALRGTERGRQHVLDEIALFALMLGCALRQRGLPLKVAGSIMKHVHAIGLEKLRHQFALERIWLIVVGDVPTDGELFTTAEMDEPFDPSIRRLIGDCVPVYKVNLHECYCRFEREVAALLDEREKQTAART